MKIKTILAFVVIALLANQVSAATKDSSTHSVAKKNVASTKNAVVAPKPLAVGKTPDSYFHAPFVFASPYLSGAKSEYNASDLITNWPSINEDLSILEAQKKHANALEMAGLPYPDRPIISLSGYVEGRASAFDNAINGVKSDINLTGAELDVLAQMTPWASAYMSMEYRDYPLPIGPRASNSGIYLSRAFLTIGNLDKLPIYGTMGQIYVPFGKYSSNMIGDSVTKLLGRTKARVVELGFFKSKLQAQVYAFKGDSDEDKYPEINNGGANLGYSFKISDKFSATLGAGYIYNVADSRIMQYTGGVNNGSFVGFSGSSYYSKSSSEDLVHCVAGGDAYIKLVYGEIMHGEMELFAEYVSALRAFDADDLMFDGNGARPSAFDVEAAYRFKVISKPAFISAHYGQTSEALALNLPLRSYVGTMGISLWKSTVQKIEYRHELNYGYNDYASGGHQPDYIMTSADRIRNVAMFQVDVFF